MGNDGGREAVASLRRYLEELKETGVVELPRTAVTGGEKVAPPLEASCPVAESALPAPAAEPHVQTAAGETLEDIRRDLGECARCSLGSQRTNLVFGVGNPSARLVFIGEAPGREEDLKGEPFVGEAGQLLTKIIQAMGFSRDDVYICNVLKCRPPGNRNPHHEEIEQCAPFMLRQVRAIAPEAVVALGTFAAQTLLATKEPISRLRGRFHDYHGIPLMPTFHPAFLVRNPERKREVWDDMKKVMALMGKETPGKKG